MQNNRVLPGDIQDHSISTSIQMLRTQEAIRNIHGIDQVGKYNILDLWHADALNNRPVASNVCLSILGPDPSLFEYGVAIEINNAFTPIGVGFTLDPEFQSRYRGSTSLAYEKGKAAKHMKYNKERVSHSLEKNLDDSLLGILPVNTILLSRNDVWRFTADSYALDKGEEKEEKHANHKAVSKGVHVIYKILHDVLKAYHREIQGQTTVRRLDENISYVHPTIFQVRREPGRNPRRIYVQSECILSGTSLTSNPLFSQNHAYITDPYNLSKGIENYAELQDSFIVNRFREESINGIPTEHSVRAQIHAQEQLPLDAIHIELDMYTGKGYLFNPRYVNHYVMAGSIPQLICKLAVDLAVLLNSYYNATYDIAKELVESEHSSIQSIDAGESPLYLFPRILNPNMCDVLYGAIHKYLNVHPLKCHNATENNI